MKMSKLKSENAKLTPIERELEAMANKLILVKKIVRGLLEEKEQWEPQWRDQAAAEAAGYNQALIEINGLKTENARLREALEHITEGNVAPGSIKEPYIDEYYSNVARAALSGKQKDRRKKKT